MRLVLDASVLVKWFIESDEEAHVTEALNLLAQVREGHVTLLQPVHWQIEVIAVLARLVPGNMPELLPLLEAIAPKVVEAPSITRRATEIATAFNHHLFDTLYHAVALECQAVLVTDDKKYFNKVAALGGICLLQDSPKLFDA